LFAPGHDLIVGCRRLLRIGHAETGQFPHTRRNLIVIETITYLWTMVAAG
jgi:hypothetical protein